jgi:hypothetical protein
VRVEAKLLPNKLRPCLLIKSTMDEPTFIFDRNFL